MLKNFWPGFRGPQKTSFLVFAFFAKFRPASGDPSLGFGPPCWARGGVFTAGGLEKRKKPKNFESRAKILQAALLCVRVRVRHAGAPVVLLNAGGVQVAYLF